MTGSPRGTEMPDSERTWELAAGESAQDGLACPVQGGMDEHFRGQVLGQWAGFCSNYTGVAHLKATSFRVHSFSAARLYSQTFLS